MSYSRAFRILREIDDLPELVLPPHLQQEFNTEINLPIHGGHHSFMFERCYWNGGIAFRDALMQAFLRILMCETITRAWISNWKRGVCEEKKAMGHFAQVLGYHRHIEFVKYSPSEGMGKCKRAVMARIGISLLRNRTGTLTWLDRFTNQLCWDLELKIRIGLYNSGYTVDRENYGLIMVMEPSMDAQSRYIVELKCHRPTTQRGRKWSAIMDYTMAP